MLRHGIVFVIVTDGTASCEPHPCLHRCTCAIDRITIQPFVSDGSAFTRRDVATIETRGDKLILSRFRQEIARELPLCEFIERQILIESFDNPVTIRPHLAFVVQMQTVSVGVSRHI